MAKRTLLSLVQSILSDMNSDEVNSISDTIEAQQVASVVKDTFYNLFGDRILPEEGSPILLTALADTARPTYLKIPEGIFHIDWIQYNWMITGDADYRPLIFQEPSEFVRQSTMISGQSDTTVISDSTGVKLNIITNKNPQYWTTFDDQTIICDSYDSDTESTLQSSKTFCWGQEAATFELSDSYVPAIDDNLFPLLLAESKSRASVAILGRSNPKEEQEGRKQSVRTLQHLWKANQRKPYDRHPNYGRPVR